MKYLETARRLREALDDKGMKAQDLVNKSGVAKASVSHYITGSHTPSNITAKKMADVLDVSPLWLMGFDVEKTLEPYFTNEEADELAQELVDRPELKVLFNASRDLSKEDIQFVVDMIERMK